MATIAEELKKRSVPNSNIVCLDLDERPFKSDKTPENLEMLSKKMPRPILSNLPIRGWYAILYTMKKTEPNGFMTLKIELPPTGIVRTIVVPAHMSLEDLHYAIQSVMGWDSSHLWKFTDNKRDGVIYEPPQPSDYTLFSKRLTIDPYMVSLKRVFPRKGSKLHYEYDFGDSWYHTITRMADPKTPETACVKSVGPDGIDDFGGQWRLGDFIKAMTDDPSSKAYDEMRESAGLDTPARLKKYLAGESAEKKTKKLRSALKHVEPVRKSEKSPPMTEDEKANALGLVFATLVDSVTWKILDYAMRNGGKAKFLDPNKDIGSFFLTMFDGLKVKDGLCTPFHSNPSELTVLPEWVEMYKTHGEDWRALHEQFDLLENYASATAHLYGVLTVEELHETILRYDPTCSLSPDKCLEILDSRACYCPNMPFRTDGRLLVSESAFPLDEEDIDNDIAEFREEQAKCERWYPPTRDDLLKWADLAYFPETPESEEVKRILLASKAIRGDEAEAILPTMCHMLSLCFLPENTCDSMIENGFIYDPGERQRRNLIAAMESWYKVINIPVFNGNTPGWKLRTVKAQQKVGRNEPCPCGSGKKFKHCCGRNQ